MFILVVNLKLLYECFINNARSYGDFESVAKGKRQTCLNYESKNLPGQSNFDFYVLF